jgi:hypothetical protein
VRETRSEKKQPTVKSLKCIGVGCWQRQARAQWPGDVASLIVRFPQD